MNQSVRAGPRAFAPLRGHFFDRDGLHSAPAVASMPPMSKSGFSRCQGANRQDATCRITALGPVPFSIMLNPDHRTSQFPPGNLGVFVIAAASGKAASEAPIVPSTAAEKIFFHIVRRGPPPPCHRRISRRRSAPDASQQAQFRRLGQ